MQKNLDFYVKSYFLLDDNTCRQTVKELKDSEKDQADAWHLSTYNSKNENKEPSVIRYDFSYIHTSTRDAVMQSIWKAFHNYTTELNFPWWNSWKGFSMVRFNRYIENQLVQEHCDHIHNIFDGDKKGIPIITALGLLNDDHGGGDLIMWQDTILPFRAGEIKVFPSNFLFPHRIEPVTKGVRYSFVAWAW